MIFVSPEAVQQIQRQVNLYVTGQLHEMVDDNYHRVYDLGDTEVYPTSLSDVRIFALTEFQSVKSARLEVSITTTTLLQE